MYVLGLDIGTTKSAAVLLERKSGCPAAFSSQANGAGTGRQSVPAILESLAEAVRGLPEEKRRRVGLIGITGQMHGVVCWGGKRNPVFENWQSTLAAEFGVLENVRRLPGCEALCGGYGFATLAVPGFCKGFLHAGTVMDYLGAQLTGRERSVMECSNAASWGLWDFSVSGWDRKAVAHLGIPPGLLPRPVAGGFPLGGVCPEWARRLGIPEGARVMVPIGDNPAAVIGSGGSPETDLFLTVGTGAQLAFHSARPEEMRRPGMFERRPFPAGGSLFVGAVLCGGKAVEILARFLADVLRHFSADIPMEEIYRKIAGCGTVPAAAPLRVSTRFMGERAAPALRGEIHNICVENLSFQELCRAWHAGLLDSLLDGLPPEIARSRRRIVVNGNAVRKSPLMLRLLRQRMPEHEILLPDTREEAACGAALYAMRSGMRK